MDKHTVYIVRNPAIARALLKKGYSIIDIKPNRHNKKMSVYVFKSEDGINEECQAIKNNLMNKNKKGA